MRSAFIFPAVVICVSSVFSQQPFVRYSENLKKVVPNHYKNDKENTYRSLDQIARGHKVEPRQPPLKPEPSIPWFQWLQQGRWAAHADRNTELHKVRARLLEQKLKPNQLAFRPRIDPQQKPNLKPAERNSIKRNTENVEVKKESNVRTRHKRDVAMTQVKPAIHHQETKMSGTEQFGGGESEKRDKRQILYFINSPNRPIQLMPRPPRTTPNPFIRDTHIEEYDIIRPEVGEREGMIPTIETGSSDPGSYPLVNEDSPEFSKIISQFYLSASDEYWPQIQQFAENILQPLSHLHENKEELINVIQSVNKNQRDYEKVQHESKSRTSVKGNDETKRVKRRVNKTLKRKRAKKKKQRLRRFERKRLRMLTHARRVRKQQKSKQERLARHYARMNMTTPTPDHFTNHTIDGKIHLEKGEITDEEADDEYESSEYEDYTDESEDSKNGSHKSEKSEYSEETDSSDSETNSKHDDGNDDYEEYEESDEEYEDETSEESKKKTNVKASVKNGVGKKRVH